ncbi:MULTISPECIES: alpha/beta hydrolase [unclassified Rathayibacter]|uniref:alpha/beta hydrolase n=1 Tax=unclassified Rathayibacter TaxID=2609250 RepID=UPI001FB44609|nr:MULTISPECIES: alpha/beta hydrolase [unclassified Rathayibacter]MCJ1674592.1 alpha/beta hydrolase [Rathayibacter sp. VKM Ac-2929]MCJ1684873.1 alpha/beta hydrolase [Rathayibacter sp. VKM Ac-2928]
MSDQNTTTPETEDRGPRGLRRRHLLALAGAGGAAALGAAALGGLVPDGVGEAQEGRTATEDWDKTFPRDPDVDHEKVTFTNRLGLTLVGDLYSPRGVSASTPSRALIVGHPFGGVKEQTSGLYAQTLAARGFVTLAFDASYNGESGGTPHFIASPEAFVEDFSAAADYLGLHRLVDADRLGVLGVCGSGGFSLAAAQTDTRMKAVATVSMYDMGRDRRQALGDTMTEEQRREQVDVMSRQRWAEARGEETEYVLGTPETITADSPAVAREFYDYYRTPRGQHPRSTTEMSLTSNGALMRFHPFESIEWISPRPILLVHGEVANSRYFSEDAYQRAAEPKELYIVPGAGHVDLYDRVDLIPWDRLADFFTQNL